MRFEFNALSFLLGVMLAALGAIGGGVALLIVMTVY